MRNRLLALICILTMGQFVMAQQPAQTIKGQIMDKDTKQPLPGVVVIIEGSNPVIGTSTDRDGYYKLVNIPVGRHSLAAMFIGYEPVTIPNIIVNAGKESVVNFEMLESVVNLDEVVVEGRSHKAEALNKMSMVSARSFTVEETKRYAGGFNDPSRMAASFAGVSGTPEGENDIIIRGNSPRGLLWRLEGVEIPNPNHFAEEGATGGPISILNTTTLGNSDFLTGAFPAEYGNAYSGVFDIQMRKGNNEKREYSFQAGVIGTDFSFEGPFSKNGRASYLFNYRYSSLAMMNKIGIKIAGDAVPKFQDLTFKLNFPNTPIGEISMFGLGGQSHVEEKGDYWTNQFETDMGVVGISNLIRPDNNTYIKNTLAYSGSQNLWDYEENNTETNYYDRGQEKFIYGNIRLSSSINRRMSNHNSIKTGFIYSRLNFNLFENSFSEDEQRMISDLSDDGSTNMVQAFMNWRYRPFESLTINTGVHYMRLFVNEQYAIEPRFGAKWRINGKQSLSAGFGIHSKAESLSTYFAQVEKEDRSTFKPNNDLQFGKARHYVIGYDHLISKNLYLKTEIYYQQLYNVPIENNDSSTFSALNYSWGYTTTALENEGTGRNYGAEITLEKFFSRDYYFLLTTSLYDSKFVPGDGNEYHTRYNGNYVLNLLGGKEFKVGKVKSKGNIIGVNFRGSMAGGQRYTPIDLEKSIEKGYTVRSPERTFAEKYDDFVRFDLKVSFKRNKNRTTRVWEIDVQNITNNLNVAGDYFSREEGKIETYTQMGLLPILNYRIEF